MAEEGEAKKEREREGAKTSEEELEAIKAKMVGGGGGGGEKTGYPFHFGSAQKGSKREAQAVSGIARGGRSRFGVIEGG